MTTQFKNKSLFKQQITHTFRSLRHPNFRLYFIGQFLSLCGTWMQSLAVSWLVYRLTKSPWMLGVVNFANLSPTLLFGLTGGHLADKFNRKKILLTTQTIAMLQSAVLAYLVLSHKVQIWEILVLVAILGTVNAFDIPARQSLIAQMVIRDDLVNAISLNASMFNAARMIGPAIAGLLVTYCGEGICFALNSVSFLAVILAILFMRIGSDDRHLHNNKPGAAWQGIQFVIMNKQIRNTLLLVMALSFFGMQYLMLLPVFASEVLHGQAILFGTLMAFAGMGSLPAALFLANRASGNGLSQIVGIALLGFSTALIAFALVHVVYLSLILVTLVAFCMTFQLSASQSLIQLAVPDHLRGKVMSVYMMIFMGMGPLGNLIAGGLARQMGAPTTLLICAIICACAAFIYIFSSPKTRNNAIN